MESADCREELDLLRSIQVTGLGSPLSPALVIWLLSLDTAAAKSLLLFGALPPAVFNYFMAEKYYQHPDLVVSMVAIGNVFALISIPLVLAFLL
jgi:predicted permease